MNLIITLFFIFLVLLKKPAEFEDENFVVFIRKQMNFGFSQLLFVNNRAK